MEESKQFYLAALFQNTVHVWTLPPATNASCDSSNLPVICSYQSESASFCRDLTWHPCVCKLVTLYPRLDNQIHVHRVLRDHDHTDIELYRLLLSDTGEGSSTDRQTEATCIAFPQRSGRYLAVGRTDGLVDVYTLRRQLTLRVQLSYPVSHSSSSVITCVTWAACDRLLIVGTQTGDLFASLAATTGNTRSEMVVLFRLSPLPSAPCLTLCAFTADTKLVAAGYTSGLVVILRLSWPLSARFSDHVIFRCIPTVDRSLFTDSVAIACSPTDPNLLITCGAPDLCLRVWRFDHSTSNSTDQPQKLLTPSDTVSGYVTCALGPDGFTLAVGLLDGCVHIKNLRDLSSPGYKLVTGSLSSARFLSFAPMNHSTDEVKFTDSVHIDSRASAELHDMFRSDSLDPLGHTITRSDRKVCGDLTNLNESLASQACGKWTSIFQGISIPELSDLSDCGTFKHSSQSVSVHQSGSIIDDKSRFAHVKQDSPQAINPILLPQAPIPGKVDCLTGIADRDQLEDFRTDIRLSHFNMLYHFSRLEHKIDRMFEQLSQTLTKLKQESDSLRVELDKRSYFY
ncbi:uncharacterized protein DEA37_0007964 [Paragonimus westermani]|uniref:WD repeat-containing protein 18 n=1 Tax=Paragonimus westermani TaxID=34504 RepID=A0A5J4NVB9_9TREM|nr:uncharacterized protein DEA37_0007964 [Paragonimus westermani]